MASVIKKIKIIQTFSERKSEKAYLGFYKNTLHVVKYFEVPFTSDERNLWQFLSSNTSKNLFHPIEFGKTNNYSYLIFPWIEGITLSEIGTLSPYWAVRILRSILNGLCELENAGFVHGDISSKNILLKPNSEIVLIDPALTGLGTLSYCAPERFSLPKASISSDIYSCGILLLELLSGKLFTEYFSFEKVSSFARSVDSFLVTEKLFALGLDPKFLSVLEPFWKKTLRENPENRAESFDELDEILEIAEKALAPNPFSIEEEFSDLKQKIQNKIIPINVSELQKKSSNLLINFLFIASFLLLVLLGFIFLNSASSVDEAAKNMLEQSRENLLYQNHLKINHDTLLNTEILENLPLPENTKNGDVYE